MAYDQQLSERVRLVLTRLGCAAVERKMFGGITFMVHGHMCCGVVNTDLVLRLPAERVEEALRTSTSARPMDFTGKPMKSMLYVDGNLRDQALRDWIEEALGFVRSLPAK